MKNLAALAVIIACATVIYFTWHKKELQQKEYEKVALLEKNIKKQAELESEKDQKYLELMERMTTLEEKVNSGVSSSGNKIGNLIDAALMLAESDNQSIQHQACSILGQLGGEKAEEKLIEIAKNSQNPHSAYNALAQMGSEKALKIIIDVIKKGNKREKSMVAGNLQRLLTAEYVMEVAKILPLLIGNDYSTRNIRTNIIRAVADSGDPRVTEYILPYLTLSDDNSVYTIIDALGKLRDPTAAEALCSYQPINDRIKKRLEQVLKNYPGVEFDKEKKEFHPVSEEKMNKLLEMRKRTVENLKKAIELRKEEEKEVF